MFSTRRLAKRSIVGTRISAVWTDGRFYPGVIQSTDTHSSGQEFYTVSFDDGFTKVFKETDIVGPGFRSVSCLTLKPRQKVFLTHNGREVTGHVLNHDPVRDEVKVLVRPQDSGELELSKKIEEIRLMESRKSARLQDSDTNYSRLADVPTAQTVASESSKKRAVSSVIDVPSAKQRLVKFISPVWRRCIAT